MATDWREGCLPEGDCDFVVMLPRSAEGTFRREGTRLRGVARRRMQHYAANVTRTRRRAARVTGRQRPLRGAERGLGVFCRAPEFNVYLAKGVRDREARFGLRAENT